LAGAYQSGVRLPNKGTLTEREGLSTIGMFHPSNRIALTRNEWLIFFSKFLFLLNQNFDARMMKKWHFTKCLTTIND
jgi:hypothetical protein